MDTSENRVTDLLLDLRAGREEATEPLFEEVYEELRHLARKRRQQSQNLIQIYETTPKQGAESVLEAALRQHANWREEHGDPWQWNVYQVVQGENYGTYIVRSEGHTWSDSRLE